MATKLLRTVEFIAAAEKLRKRDLDLEEIRFFQKEHSGHLGYTLELFYEKDTLSSIVATCKGALANLECAHVDPNSEFRFSILYSRKPLIEIRMQRDYRNGLTDRYGDLTH